MNQIEIYQKLYSRVHSSQAFKKPSWSQIKFKAIKYTLTNLKKYIEYSLWPQLYKLEINDIYITENYQVIWRLNNTFLNKIYVKETSRHILKYFGLNKSATIA
jgi:hypothetical protein